MGHAIKRLSNGRFPPRLHISIYFRISAWGQVCPDVRRLVIQPVTRTKIAKRARLRPLQFSVPPNFEGYANALLAWAGTMRVGNASGLSDGHRERFKGLYAVSAQRWEAMVHAVFNPGPRVAVVVTGHR